ncbi:hypothetical protein K458DRAFT_397055 [Lentithecium fluviatile CBS 122367]|uniref:Uncharacterized protein n=1 Tax=Lentithecium fluviatile CBS 122367 TaxID=1168545 RepID=A0A6G1IDN3_9PLEO|nr:hypothetical protein K458DRAFT_397055 [Lentithecium fluviatile CBS 122367]
MPSLRLGNRLFISFNCLKKSLAVAFESRYRIRVKFVFPFPNHLTFDLVLDPFTSFLNKAEFVEEATATLIPPSPTHRPSPVAYEPSSPSPLLKDPSDSDDAMYDHDDVVEVGGDRSSPLTSPPAILIPPSSPTHRPSPVAYEPLDSDNDLYDYDDVIEDDGERSSGHQHRHARMTSTQKLDAVVETLRAVRWTFKDFIIAWVALDREDTRVNHRMYHKSSARRRRLVTAMNIVTARGICSSANLQDLFQDELTQLIKLPSFSKFNITMDLERIDYTSAIQEIKDNSPT